MIELVFTTFLLHYLVLRERTLKFHKSGNNGEKVTPVPIPNTEVKLLSADGSWDFVPVRVGRCQARIKDNLIWVVFFVLVRKGNEPFLKLTIRSR